MRQLVKGRRRLTDIDATAAGPALAGALVAGALVVALAARFREPETLILLGVSISAFAGALSSLVYNLSPSPITATAPAATAAATRASRSSRSAPVAHRSSRAAASRASPVQLSTYARRAMLSTSPAP